MKTIPCPLCESNEVPATLEAEEFVLKRRYYTLSCCRNCGHVFINPAPDGDELEQYYVEAVPRLRALYADGPTQSPTSVAECPIEQEKIELLSSLHLLDHAGSILDVGFGNGGFVLSMSELGWRSVGLEFTEKVDLTFDPAGKFEALFGLESLDRIEPGQFDLITLWHVLEHLSDPVDVLRSMRRLLKPEGKIIIAVPNIASLSARVFGRYWYALSPPWHLHQFTPRTLNTAFCEAGFLLDEVRGFGDQARRICWVDSATNLIDSMYGSWYSPLFRFGFRLLRKAISITAPMLLSIEQSSGRPGAMVALGKKNSLLEAV
jgi:2-polyprenyl-3-methyl-5-hydroxy-6-metoxy-1,4-benzoquinol methylase